MLPFKNLVFVLVLLIAVTPFAFLLMPFIVLLAGISGVIMLFSWLDKRVEA
jgi:hypothetical protein